MSHIFDALQKSESETTGTESPSFSLATELLQAAERRIRDADMAAEQRSLEQRSVEQRSVEQRSLEQRGLEQRSAETIDAKPPLSSLDTLERRPVLSVAIPQDSRLVSVGEEESLGAEKFRFLAVRFRQLRQSRPLKKILITSTIPQEGKSTVAANLACTLARRKQQKTLLLEGDLRRPTVAAQFGLGNIPGLCEYLSGRTSGMNLYHLESLGLWVMPAGAAPQNPLELIQSGRMSSLMEQLESWFDWIVIDSPPVLPLADTSIWSRMADGILLVTRPGVTEKQQLQRGLASLEAKKLLGALVNGSTDVAHSDYYQRYAPPVSSPPGLDGVNK